MDHWAQTIWAPAPPQIGTANSFAIRVPDVYWQRVDPGRAGTEWSAAPNGGALERTLSRRAGPGDPRMERSAHPRRRDLHDALRTRHRRHPAEDRRVRTGPDLPYRAVRGPAGLSGQRRQQD